MLINLARCRLRHVQAAGRVVLLAAGVPPAAGVLGPAVGPDLRRGAERHVGVAGVVLRGLAVRGLAQDAAGGARQQDGGGALRVRRRGRGQQGHGQGARARAEEDGQDGKGRGRRLQARRLPR